MTLRRLVTSALLVGATWLAVPGSRAIAAGPPVVEVVAGDGLLLWLPASTTQTERGTAAAVADRFQRQWGLYFGEGQPGDSRIVVHAEGNAAGNLGQSVFLALWEVYSKRLSQGDRPAAQGAIRMAVLGDPSAYFEALLKVSTANRVDSSMAESAALYPFLLKETRDAAFLRDALPPGDGASHLRAALAKRGVTWTVFWNRYATWLLARSIEAGLSSPPKGGLPSVWVLDTPLAPGELAAWKFPVTDPAEGVDLEISGAPSAGMRLIHFFTDDQGGIVSGGIGDLDPGPLVLPRRGAWLWVFLWNSSEEEAGNGVAVTLWASYQAPFAVLSSEIKGGVLDLTLREEGGIASYRVWSPGTAAGRDLSTFPSEGGGDHHYRMSLRGISGQPRLRLTCLTTAGGTRTADLVAKAAGP